MPLPLLLAAAAAPSIYKGLAGLFQLNQDVKKRDSTPDAFKESLALARQAANTNRLPGEGQQVDRIAQGTAAVQAGALRAGGSSSDVLASLAAADAQQSRSLSELGVRSEAYHQQQQGQLRQGLAQQAQYQQNDQQNFEREKAALQEGGKRNVFGAIDGLSQVGAYALGKGPGSGLFDNASGTTDLYDLPDRNGYPSPYRRRYSPVGMPVPAGMMG